MKDLFEGIAWLFEEILFYPLDALRSLELESWAAANFINFFFMLIFAAAFVYWMKQLKKFDNEDKHNSQHETLG